MDPIAKALTSIYGLPSWLVRKGHGSFLTFEFGEPQLDISEPHLAPLRIEGAPEKAMRRAARVKGQWHLWIYCCDWSLRLDDLELAHNESDDITIARACYLLNGQAMTAVKINEHTGASRFSFDLGCSLVTTPSPSGTYTDEPAEQWMLYLPSGDVLTTRADGTYRLEPGNASSEAQRWVPLPPT